MKTRTISILLVLSLTVGVFYACKKDQEQTTQTVSKLSDSQVAEMIGSFKTRGESNF